MSEDEEAASNRAAGTCSPAPQGPSPTGVAVALVAMSRFLASTSPHYAAHLRASLDSAMASALDDKDLEVLRLLIKSASLAA